MPPRRSKSFSSLSQLTTRKGLTALAAGSALALASLLAYAARSAEAPAARAMPGLNELGPKKLGILRSQLSGQQGLVPAGTDRSARQALAAVPLAWEPFFGVAAMGFRKRGSFGTEKDAELLREALRRNPRALPPRLLLLRHESSAGRLNEALDQLAVIGRLDGATAEKLLNGIGAATSSTRQVDEVTVALAPHPQFYVPFLRGFASVTRPAELVEHLASRLPAAAKSDPYLRMVVMGQLVQAGKFDAARGMWTAQAKRGQGGLVNSPDFADDNVPPPFSWVMTEDSTGVAERSTSGQILLVYYGRTPGPLLRQLLTLNPGNYRARLNYSPESGTPGAISLQVLCADDGTPLGQFALDGKNGVARSISLAFTVPDGHCTGQYLQLAGRVQETRQAQQLYASSLGVEAE